MFQHALRHLLDDLFAAKDLLLCALELKLELLDLRVLDIDNFFYLHLFFKKDVSFLTNSGKLLLHSL